MPETQVLLTADAASLTVVGGGEVLAEGRPVPGRDGWELVVDPVEVAVADPDATAALLEALMAMAGRAGGGHVRWLVSAPTEDHDRAADAAGLDRRRDLVQLRRPLPVGERERAEAPVLALRPFRPGIDDAAWLEVNNRAFAHHPDQAGQRQEDLDALLAQPWFDADGFLVLDSAQDGPRSGALDGFCWTKVHADHEPPLGEIFVIGVDPAAGGRGLGRALTLAGLDHLHRRGIDVGMLYVDVDNGSAMALYRRLGFTPHHLDRLYQGFTKRVLS